MNPFVELFLCSWHYCCALHSPVGVSVPNRDDDVVIINQDEGVYIRSLYMCDHWQNLRQEMWSMQKLSQFPCSLNQSLTKPHLCKVSLWPKDHAIYEPYNLKPFAYTVFIIPFLSDLCVNPILHINPLEPNQMMICLPFHSYTRYLTTKTLSIYAMFLIPIPSCFR